MKRTYWLFWIGLSAAAGCVTLPSPWPEHQAEKPPSLVTAPPRVPDPVTADQVNEHNASEKAQALQEEMDREERGADSAVSPLPGGQSSSVKPASR